MKRFGSLLALCALTAALTACSGSAPPPGAMAREGVAPYALSEGEAYVLRSFGMEGDSLLLTFRGPEEAVTLMVRTCYLEDGQWVDHGGGEIFLGPDREPGTRLAGTFALRLREDRGFDFYITTSGRAAYTTEPGPLEEEPLASGKLFLEELQEIELDREIPVALLAYTRGTSIPGYALQDYFDPTVFAGADLVQAVTLTFSGEDAGEA